MDLSAEDDTYEQLEMFTTVLSRLKAEYVENPDLEQGINGALLGMIEAIDPFSSFVEKEIFSVLAHPRTHPNLRVSISGCGINMIDPKF